MQPLFIWLVCGLVITDGASTYLLLPDAHDLLTAIHQCTNLPDARWGLPDGGSHSQLADFMLQRNVSSVWLPLWRQKAEWRWLNGVTYVDIYFKATSLEEGCAVLTPNGTIETSSCFEENHGFVCNVSGMRQCPNNYYNEACFTLNDTFGLVGCHARSWYEARSICLARDGDLMVLDRDDDHSALVQHLDNWDIKFRCKSLYIGLRRDRWSLITPSGKEEVVQGRWGYKEPAPTGARCAVATITEEKLEWKTEICDAHHQVVCQKYGNSSDVINKGIPGTGHSLYGWVHVTVLWVLLGLVVLAYIGCVLVYFRRVNCRRNFWITMQKDDKKEPKYSSVVQMSDDFPRSRNRKTANSTKVTTMDDNLGSDADMTESHVLLSESFTISNDPESITVLVYVRVSKQTVNSFHLLIGGSTDESDKDGISENIRILRKIYRGIPMRIVCIPYTEEILSTEDTESQIKILYNNKGNIDIVYVPGMKLTSSSLNILKDLRDHAVLLCQAVNGITEDIAAEVICVGVTECQNQEQNMIMSGLLDVTCAVETTSFMMYIRKQIQHVIFCVAVLLWRQRKEKDIVGENGSTVGRTGEIRRCLARLADLTMDGFGFGDLTKNAYERDVSSPTEYPSRETIWEIPKGEEAKGDASPQLNKKKIRVVLITSNPDAIHQIDGNSGIRLKCLMDELSHLTKHTKVETVNYTLKATYYSLNWEDYRSCLAKVLKNEPDVVYLPTGFGEPPNKDIYRLIYELTVKAIVITDTVLGRFSLVHPDFPSASVISVRDANIPSKSGDTNQPTCTGATVDFEFSDGAVGLISIVCKLILETEYLKASPSSAKEPNKTRRMYSLVASLCQPSCKDGVFTLEKDAVLRTLKGQTAAEKLNRTYWTGKDIP